MPAKRFARPTTRACTSFVFLLLNGFSHLDFACALEPLRLASSVLGWKAYDWAVKAEGPAAALSSAGLSLNGALGLSGLGRGDRVVVIAGEHARPPIAAVILSFLRRESAHGAWIAGIGGGAHVLAEAGLLNGLDCAVHWRAVASFAERYPMVKVRSVAFVAAKVATASGGTAARDLLLHVIRRDHDPAVAESVADLMVYHAVRDAEAPQASSRLVRFGGRNACLSAVIHAMEQNMDEPLNARELAAVAGVGVRQLERLFARHLSSTPLRYYLSMRLDRARDLLCQTELSVMEIALATGFASVGHFSKCFRNRYGVAPTEYAPW